MKRIMLLSAVLGMFLPVFSFFPMYFGARSLALGYSSLAFNYDPNALYLNPALLNSMSSSLAGYQYQNSYLDFRDVSGKLSGILSHDLAHFQDLAAAEKESLLGSLKGVFSARAAISGFQM